MRVLSGADEVVRRIREAAERLGERTFLRLIERGGGEAELTYPQLLHQAETWARRYREAGLERAARVVVILEHGAPLYAAYLGALIAGCVPAFFAHPSEKVDDARYCAEVAALLERIGGGFVVTSRSIVARLGERLRVPGGLLEDGAPLSGRGAGAAPALTEDALFLQFSSGTTGLKKGVAVSARALLWQVDAYAQRLGVREGDAIASWLPLYHDMGLIACYFLPLLRGVPLVAMSPFDWIARPHMLLDAVARHRATLVWLPNFAYNFLATRVPAAATDWDLSSLRAVINCSEPVLASSHAAFLARFAASGLRPEALGTCYAMAENTFAVTAGGALATRQVDGRTLTSSGRALPDTAIRILGRQGEPLPDGEVGEVAISSPSLFSGYVGNPAETAQSLRDGWFHTGDLGMLVDGELYVAGRIKDTVIVGGRNLYPQDVEEIVAAVEGVIPGRAIAAGVDDARLGTQSLLIVAETRETDAQRRADLRRRIHQAVVGALDIAPAEIALADHMWLRKSTSGKLARAANRDRYLEAKSAAGDASAAAATPGGLAGQIRACVLEALRVGASRVAPPFSDDDDLARLGIVDSFSLVSLQLALEEKFGVEAARRACASPSMSVRSLAAALGGAAPGAPAPAAPQPAAAHALVPQMRDVEAQPYEWAAYLMRRGMPNYRSPTLSSDEHGFRTTWRHGAPLSYRGFISAPGPKGLVLGNSFAYGIGTTADARTFASLLNAAEMSWYNLSQRASVCIQERLACELYGPQEVAALAWVSGVNNLIGLIVGEGAPGNPAPFVGERRYATRMMPGVRFAEHAPFEQRYAAMLRALEVDVSVLALRLGKRARLGFFLQPSATWLDKRFTSEEQSLIERFDAGGALQQAHHPRHLAPLYRRYAEDLAALCGRWGVDFVDCNADGRMRRDEWLFIDRTHMTDAGHAVMAALVGDWLHRRA